MYAILLFELLVRKVLLCGLRCGYNGISTGVAASWSGDLLPLFLFHTCIGSGPDAPYLVPNGEGLGVDTLFPLAVLATSRGRGAGGREVPEVDGFETLTVSPHFLKSKSMSLPLSPLVLAADAVGVPAFARKFFVTDTALKVAGFLTELDRAWCLVFDSSLLVDSD